MKIDGMNSVNILNQYTKNNIKAEKRQESINPKDIIEISNEGKALNNYSSEKISDNNSKVQEIKDKIEIGVYKVDSRMVAKRMLDNIKESSI